MKKLFRFVCFVPAVVICIAECFAAGEILSGREYAELRYQARERRRKVILNNDGCDVIYYPEKMELSRENFLSRRTAFLAGKCDTLMYCPGSAGQGHFTVDLPGADLLSGDPPRPGFRNIAKVLHEQQLDYFQWIIDFCRKNSMEIFFSFRFNDTHDVKHTPEKPSIFFSKFKDENRHLLFGRDHTKSPRNGWWSSLDFSHAEVRARQVALTKAVLEKYDVDGIDLDFSRYLRIFRRTAAGEKASEEELEMMTALIRDIRKTIDDAGKRKGKAILLSIVLPDDAELCRNLGYDVEKWFRENLIDIWQQSDGFQLGSIKNNVEKAHRYGVKYYAFAGSPYPYGKLEKGSLMNRSSVSAYSGRLSNAICGGADGIYLYNISSEPLFKTAVEAPQNGPMRYFVTGYTWEIPRGYCFSPADYGKYTQLTAHVKCSVSPGAGKLYQMEINRVPGAGNEVTAYIDRQAGASGNLKLLLNGKELVPGKKAGRYESFIVPPEVIIPGMNRFDVQCAAASGENPIWFFPRKLKDFELNIFKKVSGSVFEENAPGDFTVYGGEDTAGFGKRFANLEFSVLRFNFSAKLLQEHAFARFANAGYALTLQLYPGKIAVPEKNFVLPLDTEKFHSYQIEMKKSEFTLSIDGKKVFSAEAVSTFTPQAFLWIPDSARMYGSSSSFIFGVGAGTSGIAQIRDICVDSPPGSVQIGNLMLEVLPREKMAGFSGGCFRAAPGKTGKRILDGRAVPFAGEKGKKILGAKVSLMPGSRRTVLVVSDGKSVSAWLITDGGVAMWPGNPVAMNLGDRNKADVFHVLIQNGKHKFFRNGALIYTAGNMKKSVYLKGELLSRSEVPSPEEFLADYGSRFTRAEQDVILSGGMLARGLREYNPDLIAGELVSAELYETGGDIE